MHLNGKNTLIKSIVPMPGKNVTAGFSELLAELNRA